MTPENLADNQAGTENSIGLEQKNRQVLGALAQSLSGGLELAEYQSGNSLFVDRFMDFFKRAKQDSAITTDAKKVGEITKLGTLLLDAVLIDELAPYSEITSTKGKAPYGRSETAELIRDFPIIDDFLKSYEGKDKHYHAGVFTQE